MSGIRALQAPAEHYFPILSFYLRELQSRGKKVVLLTFNRPYEQLKEALHDEGVDEKGLFYLDATGQAPLHTRFLPDAMFIGSPNQLESTALRLRLVCQRMGPDAHVVLDSMNLVAQYNSLANAQEFAHHVVNSLRLMKAPADLMIVDTADGDELADAIAVTVDAQERLEASS